MRLIDADAFMDEVTQQIEFIKVFDIGELTQVAEVLYEGVKAQIEKMPTIDVEPVVRCKDCIYHGDFNDIGWCTCENTGAGVPKDGFCSDGERDEVEE